MLANHAKALLEWYIDAGVDEAISPDPVDWFAASKAKAAQSAAGSTEIVPLPSARIASATPNRLAPASLAAAIAEARNLADAASSLVELEKAVRGFDGCVIKKTAKNTVFAQGVPTSDVMLIGEAPGAEEDAQGVPFCGPSGKLLDEMLKWIGLERDKNFYITNTLFWRPPGNRQPTEDEIEICRPFIEKHIALINPKLLVLVGGTAAKAVLGETSGITHLRKKEFIYKNQYTDKELPVKVIFHPSYLLRQPLQKKLAWSDLLKIQSVIESLH